MRRKRAQRSGPGYGVTIAAALVLLYLVFPILVVIPLSFSAGTYLSFPPPGFSLRWYANFFGRTDWLSAASLSLWVGAAVMLLATALGAPAALALVRRNLLLLCAAGVGGESLRAGDRAHRACRPLRGD